MPILKMYSPPARLGDLCVCVSCVCVFFFMYTTLFRSTNSSLKNNGDKFTERHPSYSRLDPRLHQMLLNSFTFFMPTFCMQ